MSLYSGTPGSGKSLHATDRIRRRLKRGMPVIANYNLDRDNIPHPELFTYLDNSELDPKALVDYAREWFGTHKFGEDRILLVIDECQLLFNSREWDKDKDARMRWIQFFSQHRKYGYCVILVAQFDKMIDRQFRALLEYEYMHRKVSNFGLVGWLMSLVFLGRAHVCIQRYYPLNQRLGAKWFIARKSIFAMYDSFGDFARLEDTNEDTTGASDTGSWTRTTGRSVPDVQLCSSE